MQLLLSSLLTALTAIVASHRFPSATPEAAWAQLPRENPRLPAWARILIKPLPRTTGAMLELDRLHRVDNPIGPVLAAKLRWLAADAIHCEYARAMSIADLQRAGAASAEISRLVDNRPSPSEKRLFAFARQITKAAYLVTDAEFAELLKQFGPEKMTAIVHTLAFANFEYRIFLALGVQVEPGGPCPPLSVKLDAKRRSHVTTPPRPPWEQVTSAITKKKYESPPDWKDVNYADLEKGMAAQKARTPRVPLPDASRFAKLNADVRRQSVSIVWTRISAGYQPVMTQAWFAGLREFQQEARLNRLFASSLFWIVTRTNDCFY